MPIPEQSTEAPSTTEGIDYRRGIAAGLIFGAIGFCAPIIVLAVITAIRWFLENAPAIDRNADLQRIKEQLIFMVIGGTFLFSAAGWATYAPRGNFKFAWTLLKIFVLTVASWYLLRALGILQPRCRIEVQSLIYPAEVLILGLPPLLIAAALTLIRCKGTKKNNSATS
jgi:hypothetical protein